MRSQPVHNRSFGYAAILYLMVSIVSLYLMISSSMSEIHATGDFAQGPSVVLLVIGTIVGIGGLGFTIAAARRGSVNSRVALFAWGFGTLIFALALYGAARFNTPADAGPGGHPSNLTPADAH